MEGSPNISALFPEYHTRHDGEPFELADFWRPSAFVSSNTADTTLFSLPGDPTVFTFRASIPPRPTKPSEEPTTLFGLPTDFKSAPTSFVSQSQYCSFGEFTSDPPTSDTSGDDENVFSSIADPEEPEEEDVWLDPDSAALPEKPRVLTWDSFLIPGANNPENPYLTEAGPLVLDAAIEEYSEEEAGAVIRSDVFCTCLLHMGLGRSSVLFTYDRIKDEFRPAKEKLRVSGCTVGTVASIVKTFAQCGVNIKKLQRFADTVYRNTSSSSPSLVALAQCATTVVESIQKRLSLSYRGATIKSVLHLHSLVLEPALIVDAFVKISDAAAGVSDDSELLSKHFEVIQQQQHRSGWMRPLLVETLSRVSRPWLEFVEQWVGLAQRGSSVKLGQFVEIEEIPLTDEAGKERMEDSFNYVESRIPSFMSAETASVMFETGKSLRYLERYHPHHPLVAIRGGTKRPGLEWKFSWEDLEILQQQAKAHERTLKAEIEKYVSNQTRTPTPGGFLDDTMETDLPFETFGRSKSEIITLIEASSNSMNLPLSPLAEPDRLSALLLTITSATPTSSFAPPLPITPLLSFSQLLTTQSLLINKSTLNLFLHEHSLQTHLSYLHRFLLFTDGVFSSRLASALFSAEATTTERSESGHRTASTLGLRLGSRSTWPPASSELRLALTDVLSSCFNNTKDLPGGLSFTVRDMSPTEIAACTDPNSITALDFLRIEYRPPAPLEAVITPTSLYYYDKIFKFLLRLLRMVYVVNTTFWERTRRSSSPAELQFCTEARHFVTTLSSYITTAGIGTTWARFESKLAAIAITAEQNNSGATSLKDIRDLHESTLDRIMFAVLAKHKQKGLMEIIEEIFTTVLRFAADEGADAGKALRRLRKRVEVFKSVCRGLGGERRYGGKGGRGEGYKEEAGLLGMLLVGLEMGMRGETGRGG